MRSVPPWLVQINIYFYINTNLCLHNTHGVHLNPAPFHLCERQYQYSFGFMTFKRTQRLDSLQRKSFRDYCRTKMVHHLMKLHLAGRNIILRMKVSMSNHNQIVHDCYIVDIFNTGPVDTIRPGMWLLHLDRNKVYAAPNLCFKRCLAKPQFTAVMDTSHSWCWQHADIFPRGSHEMNGKLDTEYVEYHCSSKVGTKRQYSIHVQLYEFIRYFKNTYQ